MTSLVTVARITVRSSPTPNVHRGERRYRVKNESHNSSASFRITHSECMKQGDFFSQLPFNFVLKHESVNVQENPARLQRNGSLQFLVHADDNYLQDENMKSTAKNGALIANKGRGPELNAVKIKYIFMCVPC